MGKRTGDGGRNKETITCTENWVIKLILQILLGTKEIWEERKGNLHGTTPEEE